MEFTISGFGQINEKKDFFPKLGYARKCKKIKSVFEAQFSNIAIEIYCNAALFLSETRYIITFFLGKK